MLPIGWIQGKKAGEKPKRRKFWFPKQQILDSSKLREFAEDRFKFHENVRKFSKNVENKTFGEKEKLLVTSNFSFSQSVFKRLETHKNQNLSG